MARIIRLTERDLVRIAKTIITEKEKEKGLIRGSFDNFKKAVNASKNFWKKFWENLETISPVLSGVYIYYYICII